MVFKFSIQKLNLKVFVRKSGATLTTGTALDIAVNYRYITDAHARYSRTTSITIAHEAAAHAPIVPTSCVAPIYFSSTSIFSGRGEKDGGFEVVVRIDDIGGSSGVVATSAIWGLYCESSGCSYKKRWWLYVRWL
ncbi:Hypothetical predicted protein [Olea europaea subsp. europaea]|uniref:Uncharacterized protein n=1 Tax=Olea europaea subsp. europaea TaxID=158383 RepID=A0A8S0RU35_OLEEU|nr:Hypothetical predicted protein [Olea europaea subsp. europaea]